MIKTKTLINKTWVFAAAAVIIVGSSSAMVFALNNSIPESNSANAARSTKSTKSYNQAESPKTGITAEYTLIDLSKNEPDPAGRDAFYDKMMVYDLSTEQIDEKYRAMIANTIPGEKDITAEQAAAYAAGIVEKAYGVDLAGYTAEASFSRNPVPNSDNWGVIFHAPEETASSVRYSASVDSVSGIMLYAGTYSLDFRAEGNNKNLEDPAWLNTAVQDITRLLPEHVSITNSKVVCALEIGGVSVVCELSDGSAYAVRLSGENKDAAAYQYFPEGYDGSWDYHPPTANGVG